MQLRCPVAAADGRVIELSDADGRSARVVIRCDGEDVEFAVEATGAPSPHRPGHPEWYNRAHFVVQLNPGHDHVVRMRYGVDDGGRITGEAHWTIPGEEPGDGPAIALEEPPVARGAFQRVGEDGFRAVLRLPADVVWLPGTTVTGLCLKVGFHEEVIPEPLVWPEAGQWWEKDFPIGFGDLHREEPTVRVEGVDVATPAWSLPTDVTVRVAAPAGEPSALRLTGRVVLPGHSVIECERMDWRGQGGAIDALLPVVFPHIAKWETTNGRTGALELTLRDEAGTVHWAGSYPFGFDFGVIVRERYGPAGEPLPDRPESDDPEFVEKFRRYILTRLPDYRAAATKDGAASDFMLVDPDGELTLDLAADDWPETLVRLVAERFGRWDDALAAISMWLYHPLVTRHSSSRARVAGSVLAADMPRVGGCFCGDTARIGAMLAERLGEHLGEPMQSWTIGLRGHLATLVSTPVGRVVIDGMIGHWYHTLDNTRLATLEEMRSRRRIVERMWYCPQRHGHELYFQRNDQIIRDWSRGVSAFPAPTPE